MRLDPLSPLNEVARKHLGFGLAAEGRYQEAMEMFRREGAPSPRAQMALVFLASELGRDAEAREELLRYEGMTAIPIDELIARSLRHERHRATVRAAIARIRTAG